MENIKNDLHITFDEDTDVISIHNETTDEHFKVPASAARYTAALSGEFDFDTAVGAAVTHVVDGLELRDADMYLIQEAKTGNVTIAFKDKEDGHILKVIMEDTVEPIPDYALSKYITTLNGNLVNTKADTIEGICKELEGLK